MKDSSTQTTQDGTQRLVEELGLSAPYDWSNPAMCSDQLIAAVLLRGIFDDICRVKKHFGIDAVKKVYLDLERDEVRDKMLVRMLKNIEWSEKNATKDA